MQTDDDIGKLAVATPFLMSKAVEVFIQRIVTQSMKFLEPSQPGLSVFAVHKCVEAVEEFDFVREIAGTFMAALPADTPSSYLVRQARLSTSGEEGRRSSRRVSKVEEQGLTSRMVDPNDASSSDALIDGTQSDNPATTIEPKGAELAIEQKDTIPSEHQTDTPEHKTEEGE